MKIYFKFQANFTSFPLDSDFLRSFYLNFSLLPLPLTTPHNFPIGMTSKTMGEVHKKKSWKSSQQRKWCEVLIETIRSHLHFHYGDRLSLMRSTSPTNELCISQWLSLVCEHYSLEKKTNSEFSSGDCGKWKFTMWTKNSIWKWLMKFQKMCSAFFFLSENPWQSDFDHDALHSEFIHNMWACPRCARAWVEQ